MLALKAGFNFGEITELFPEQYQVRQGASCRRENTGRSPATKRWRWALIAASQLSGKTTAVLQLSDHAGQRYPAQPSGREEFRGDDVSGGGRDRGGGSGDRRQLWRFAGRDGDQRAGRSR